MYEHKKQPLASVKTYRMRVITNALVAIILLILSLGLGVVGYKYTCHYSWIDSLLNASMILGGMGPMNPIDNNIGKLFASVYALFCGVMLLTSIAVLFTPILHRFYHKFHIAEDND